MRFRTIQAAPLMQMPVFLVLFFAPVYVPLELLEGWIESVAALNPADLPAGDRPRVRRGRRAARPRRVRARDRDGRRVLDVGVLRPAQGRGRRRLASSQHSQERVHHGRVELRPGRLLEPPPRLRRAERRAVRPVGRSSRGTRRRRRRCAPRSGSPRPPARPDSRRRRSARGSSARSCAPPRAARSARGCARRERGGSRGSARSSGVSGPGFARIAESIPIFPMSWKSALSSRRLSARGSSPSSSPTRSARSVIQRACFDVCSSLASSAFASASTVVRKVRSSDA